MYGCTPLCTLLTFPQAFHLPHVISMLDLLWPIRKISQSAAQSYSTIALWRSEKVLECETGGKY